MINPKSLKVITSTVFLQIVSTLLCSVTFPFPRNLFAKKGTYILFSFLFRILYFHFSLIICSWHQYTNSPIHEFKVLLNGLLNVLTYFYNLVFIFFSSTTLMECPHSSRSPKPSWIESTLVACKPANSDAFS